MCGIFACLKHFDLDLLIQCYRKLQHRGPERNAYWYNDQYFFGFTRLSINDVSEHGDQPFVDDVQLCGETNKLR